MTTCIEEAEEIKSWPNCATPDCPNKACLAIDSKYCFPCSYGLPINWLKCKNCESSQFVFRDSRRAWCDLCNAVWLIPTEFKEKIKRGPIRV